MDKDLKKHKKSKISIGWKRSLIVSLVVTLVLGSLSFSDFEPKAQATEYERIVDIKGDTTATGTSLTLTLDSGKVITTLVGETNKSYELPANVSNVQVAYNTENPNSIIKIYYMTPDGELKAETTGNGTKQYYTLTDNVKDYVVGYNTTFVLKNDNTVWARGAGTRGQLGVGYNQNKTVFTEVVDPQTGDPLENIKKIYLLGGKNAAYNSSDWDGVLLIGDGDVYLVGRAFGQDSYATSKPINLNFFPTFATADEFDMKYVGVDYSTDYRYIKTAAAYVYSERRVFTIAGKKYSLTDFFAPDPRDSISELESTRLYSLPDDFDAKNLGRMYLTYNNNGYYSPSGVSTTYTYLADRVLTTWGTNSATYGDVPNTFDATPKTIATGVDYVTSIPIGTTFYLRNNSVYAQGRSNNKSRAGVVGLNLSSPVKITGNANQVKDIKKLAADYDATYTLNKDNILISWTDASSFKTWPTKYLDLFSIQISANSASLVYGISEDFKLHQLSYNGTAKLVSDTMPNLAPADYVAPITAPDKPVLSISSTDKFNQTVVSIDFGTTSDIATKQYQINGGGWTNYVGDITVTQSGSVKIEARSADSKGNMSEVGEMTITSDPIVITPGQPTIEKVSADEFKVSADATGNFKVQVKVDGAAWQEHNTANNLLLTPGDHVIEVRLLNDRDQELINKTFNVTADNPAPVIVAKPVVTQKGLNNQYTLDIEVAFNPADGEAQYSIDGGAWKATTGSFSVSNAVHTIQAKVVGKSGGESEIVDFSTAKVDPKVTIDNGNLEIDTGVVNPAYDVYYKDNVNGVWNKYVGAVNYPPGTYTIDVEVREVVSGDVVYVGGPFTLVVPDPNAGNPGNGGTTPTPNPGTGTPVGQEDVDFTVNSGGLSARFEGADLSTIIIDSTKPYQSINSVSRVLIEDSRGNGEGFQYSIDVSDFVSESMQDNSTNTQSLVVSIPANSLAVEVLNTKTLNGPAAELSNVGKHTFTGNGPEMLAIAKAFEGMGYNEIPLNFTLSVPDRVKIISSGSGSKFVPGESTGLMAGIYKSKLTITLSSGI
ncbi:OmpL47-type beta-barrel domain-containing protein [Paenibacillus amylolyticus]|uniref:OmpL47-type beta-barrel domain-containing protein n=1 Tax=Paenibacillus amylolyticus TaxID=1451 RepID=UPI00201D2D2A|nr:hypothetical protein [Paenibacillus amylolyticus]MCL6663426.1 hypothetical protein [Paenibacillus amylolyticus]